jgi:chromosome segregation ATPase
MAGIGDAIDWGKKLLQISGRIDKNAEKIDSSSDDIKALNRRVNQLVSYVKELKHQLDLERQKNASLQEKHQLEIKQYQTELNAYKSDLELRLEQFKTEMLKRDLENQRQNRQILPDSNAAGELPSTNSYDGQS